MIKSSTCTAMNTLHARSTRSVGCAYDRVNPSRVVSTSAKVFMEESRCVSQTVQSPLQTPDYIIVHVETLMRLYVHVIALRHGRVHEGNTDVTWDCKNSHPTSLRCVAPRIALSLAWDPSSCNTIEWTKPFHSLQLSQLPDRQKKLFIRSSSRPPQNRIRPSRLIRTLSSLFPQAPRGHTDVLQRAPSRPCGQRLAAQVVVQLMEEAVLPLTSVQAHPS